MNTKPPPSRCYTYTKISELKPDPKSKKQVNVIGIVSQFKPPGKSRGTDYFSTISIVDESCSPLQCLLFSKDRLHIPSSCNSGDVICIRRGTISEFEGRLQLKGTGFSSWLLYQTGSDNPVCSSVNCTVTETEMKRVQQLRKWNVSCSSQVRLSFLQSPGPSTAQTASTPAISSAPQPLDTALTGWASPGPSRVDQNPFSESPIHTTSKPMGVLKHIRLALTPLGNLVADKNNYAVCGIVQYFKPPTRSKGKDYYMSIWLLDQSCSSQPTSCTLFNPSEHRLPKDISVGSIVLLKGLKTGLYQDRVQVRGHEKTIVGVFSNTGTAPLTIGGWYTLSPVEKDVIQQLKTWYRYQGFLLVNTELSQVSLGHCFNSLSRVAAIHHCSQTKQTVLEIFDGTTTKLECEGRDASQRWITTRDRQLSFNYHTSICELHLLDWSEPVSLQPGQFVSFSNIQATPINMIGEGLLVTLTLRQSAEAIKVLDGEQPKSLSEHLERFPVPYGPFPVFTDLPCSSAMPLFEIVNEDTKQACSVQDILVSSIGSEFVVEGEIVCFANGPVEELSQLRCSWCKTRYITPQSSSHQLPSKMSCLACCAPSSSEHLVCYTYAFLFRLRDETGTIDICVTGEAAARLLQSVPPGNLYLDTGSRHRLLKLLYVLTGGNDIFYPVSTGVDCKRPKVKCCVKSFVSIKQKLSFTLMDTFCKVSF